MNRKTLLLYTTIVSASAATGGCATEPWVMPYEREYLADPIMLFSRDPFSDTYLLHVYETREAAQGGGVGSGGGCGCN